ncbi:MAG: GNAT family N-acetyltransferase [Anaerolineales bacterium]
MLTAPEVVCRPALLSDRESVMDFLPLIWEGEDYVPGVWDAWLEEKGGYFAAALLEGHVVGLSHLVDLGRGEWWLEGLRVDPRLHGRHIGSHLHDYQVENWLRTDASVVRLATHRSRTAVHRMCERTGFLRMASVIPLGFRAHPGDHRFRPAGLQDVEGAVTQLLESPVQRALAGWMDLGWRYAGVDPDRIAAAARSGGLWTWGQSQGILVTRLETGPDGPSLTISAMARPTDAAASFLADIPRLAASMGSVSGLWVAPESEASVDGLVQGGFEPESEEPLWLFERRR